jgi:translation initiation factor 1
MQEESIDTVVVQPLNISVELLNFRDDPFDMLDRQENMSVHIRLQKRNGKKCVTTVSGVNDPKGSMIIMRKKFSCGGAIIDGSIIQLQGDLRKEVHTYLIATGLSSSYIFIHGY